MKGFKNINGVPVDMNAYAEAFDGICVRILVTGEHGEIEPESIRELYLDPLVFAAYRSTATPSTVVGGVEAGIEGRGWLPGKDTPDGRDGVILQLWGSYDTSKPLEEQVEKFYKQMSIRIRQDILSVPTTRIFDWLPGEMRDGLIDTGLRVGRCGGGEEYESDEYGRKMINVPLMMGYDFQTEKELGYTTQGVFGSNIWIMGDSVKNGLEAAKSAVAEINDNVGEVITSFFVCPSGSQTNQYEPVGPPTNIPYCPTLKTKLGRESQVPEGVKSIPEIVIDGLSRDAVVDAMRVGALAATKAEGVKRVTAGNYGGNLGRHKIRMDELGL